MNTIGIMLRLGLEAPLAITGPLLDTDKTPHEPSLTIQARTGSHIIYTMRVTAPGELPNSAVRVLQKVVGGSESRPCN